MRLTTSTAATLATAGLAALVTGCSSSSPSASGPVATHHVVKAAPVAAVAAPVSPKAALAKAVRASLAAHTVQFRYRVTRTLVDPMRGVNDNPLFTAAGVLNFDSDLVTINAMLGPHSNQPYAPLVSMVVDGDAMFAGITDDLVASGNWAKSSTNSGDAADEQVSQVLQDVKGPVTVAHKTANVTEYQLQSNLSQLIIDQSDGAASAFAKQLSGLTVDENVWVNRDGRIVRARWTLDPGRMHGVGLSASTVKALYLTVDFANYGVDMFVPPHRTA